MLGAPRRPGQGGWDIPIGGPPAGTLTSALAYLECEGPGIAGNRPPCGKSGQDSGFRPMRLLTAIPVHNEEAHLEPVLGEVLRFADDVLVVDDGSTDRTPELLRKFPTVQ